MPPPKKRKLPSLSESDIAEAEPYPDHSQPTPQQCRSVRDALLHLHGFPKQFESYRRIRRNNNHQSHSLNLNLNLKQEEESNDDDAAAAAAAVGETTTTTTTSVLDGLVSTLLSQNTTDANSTRAFQSLKSSFPTWQQVIIIIIILLLL